MAKRVLVGVSGWKGRMFMSLAVVGSVENDRGSDIVLVFSSFYRAEGVYAEELRCFLDLPSLDELPSPSTAGDRRRIYSFRPC